MSIMPSLLPPSEDRYLAQYVCEELDRVSGDNRKEVIERSAKDILEDLMTDNKNLARAVREELFNCYPRIFVDKNDLPQIV